jgi:glycosyltransferase involved in cell wall biosynthesis
MPVTDWPVRVLVVSRPSRVWGAQLRLLLTAPGLRARGVELTLAVPDGNPLAERWRAAGLPMVVLPPPGPDSLRRPDGRRAGPIGIARTGAAALAGAVRLARTARRFDAVLSFSRHTHVEAAIAGRLARRPVVLEVVDIVRPGFGQRVLRAAARLATVVVANSQATASTLGTAPRDLRVLYPIVDLSRFEPGPADAALRARVGGAADRPVVAIIGRLDPGKGIELVADAFARATVAEHPTLARSVLAVVGDQGVAPDGYVEQLRAETEARLGERVVFTGRIEDVPGVLRSIDAFINASDAEPFGRSILEAQATGTPVVAARGGGVPEFVDDELTGLLFPPGDAPAAAAALERVLADRELAAAMVTAARAQTLARFDPDDRFDELAALYRELAGR